MGRPKKSRSAANPAPAMNSDILKGMIKMLQQQIKAADKPTSRKKRDPSDYNIFMSKTINELKIQYKEKLKSKDMNYKNIFKMATELWADCDKDCIEKLGGKGTFLKQQKLEKLNEKASKLKNELEESSKSREGKVRSRKR